MPNNVRLTSDVGIVVREIEWKLDLLVDEFHSMTGLDITRIDIVPPRRGPHVYSPKQVRIGLIEVRRDDND